MKKKFKEEMSKRWIDSGRGKEQRHLTYEKDRDRKLLEIMILTSLDEEGERYKWEKRRGRGTHEGIFGETLGWGQTCYGGFCGWDFFSITHTNKVANLSPEMRSGGGRGQKDKGGRGVKQAASIHVTSVSSWWGLGKGEEEIKGRRVTKSEPEKKKKNE